MSARPDVPDRLRVRRHPERAGYDRATVDPILDEALVCHVGFELDGQPYVLPMLHARVGDRLYLHGSSAGRLSRSLAGGIPVCVTVTILDGLVLARSVYNHSLNYRSVVVLGRATPVEGAEKLEALRAFTEHLAPGRWDEARRPSAQELKATAVLALSLEEASAKVRSGGPSDEPEDADLPVWAGVVPMHLAVEPSEYDWRRVREGRIGAP